MKAFVTTLDAASPQNPLFCAQFDPGIKVAQTLGDADFVCLAPIVSDSPAFNSELADKILDSGKKVAVFDYFEYGWVAESPPTPYFLNSRRVPLAFPQMAPWRDFAMQLEEKAVHFVRELPISFSGENVFPIDWLNPYTPAKIQSEKDYLARPIDVLFIYGPSNPFRRIVHGMLLFCGDKNGMHVRESIEDLSTCGPGLRVLASQKTTNSRIPHWDYMRLIEQSKTVISLPGNGHKCFRDAEAAAGSIFVGSFSEVQRMPIWKPGVNCFEVHKINLSYVDELPALLNSPKALYEMYVNAQIACLETKPWKVWNDYILPKING